MKFRDKVVRSTLLVVTTLSIACAGGALSQEPPTAEPAAAESSRPSLTPIQSPGPETIAPRSLAGKPLAGFYATPIRRITVLCGTVVHVLR